MATITIAPKIKKELAEVSHKLGVSKEVFLTNAILYYLQIFGKKIELNKELKMWEVVSDEDLMKFERKIKV